MEIIVEERKLEADFDMDGVKARLDGMMEHSAEVLIAAFVEEREDGWYTVTIQPDEDTLRTLFDEGRTPAEAFGEHVSAIMVKSGGGAAGGNLTLGSLSAKYESNGKPGAIGHDNSGGWSYGAYQLASKVGSLAKFLNFLAVAKPAFAADLNTAGGDAAARAGEARFRTAWKKLATNHADEFLELQHGYIKASHYDKFVDTVKNQINLDIGARSLAIKNVAWSTAVQHGASNTVFKAALDGAPIADGRPGDEAIINAVYAERANVGKRFPSVPELHNNLKDRFAKEKGDALQMLT